MIYLLPIEPLKERYTEQWYRWFPERLRLAGAPVTVVDGTPLNESVEVGTFLDVNSTLHYKATQLQEVARLFHSRRVSTGDVFFVADTEFWGVEAVRYLADLNRIPIKLCGFCHAGSYTREDFIEPCAPYAQHFERAWFEVFDRIFVGSNYHKRCMVELRQCPPSKVLVSGNPYAVKEVQEQVGFQEKRSRIILTNRPDYEKRPNLTLDVFESLHANHPEWDFAATTSRARWGTGWLREKALRLQERGILDLYEGISKVRYLELLAGAKVMTGNTIEENFGYCVLEAMIVGTAPVVPYGFAHPELLSPRFDSLMFHTIEEQIEIIEQVITCGVDEQGLRQEAERYEQALDAICAELIDLHGG